MVWVKFEEGVMRRAWVSCGAILLVLPVAALGATAPEVEEATQLMAGTHPSFFAPAPLSTDHHILIESRVLRGGDTATLGVYVRNDEAIRSMTIPLVIRSVTGGAYMTHFECEYNSRSRLDNFLNGEYGGEVIWPPIINTRPSPDRNFATVGPPDYVSPDAVMIARGRISMGNGLPPGTDGVPGDSGSTPMILIHLQVNESPGYFEIDSVFMAPYNRVNFIPDRGLGNIVQVTPLFYKGIVTVIHGNSAPDTWPDTTIVVVEPPVDTVPGTDIPDPDSAVIVVVDTTDDLVEPGIDTSSVVVIEPPSEDGSTDLMPVKGVSGGTTVGGRLVTKNPLGSSGLETVLLAKVLCYPNPFNSSMTARYGVVEPGDVSVGVYNILGQPVAPLFHGHRDAGEYFIEWDGENADGTQVSTGMYLLRVQTMTGVSVSKVMLLR